MDYVDSARREAGWVIAIKGIGGALLFLLVSLLAYGIALTVLELLPTLLLERMSPLFGESVAVILATSFGVLAAASALKLAIPRAPRRVVFGIYAGVCVLSLAAGAVAALIKGPPESWAWAVNGVVGLVAAWFFLLGEGQWEALPGRR